MRHRIGLYLVVICCFSVAFPSTKPESPSGTPIDIREFLRLMTNLSEPEGYFDSDNFVSNERAYLKIIPGLKTQGLSGGAYIGVGPDQNYSYIARLKPRLAFMIDIRRQNALQHLYFKALFDLSPSRVAYLERLFGKKTVPGPGAQPPEGISQMLLRIDAAPANSAFAETKLTEAIQKIWSWNPGLSDADYESIRGVARAFFSGGPDLKFTSFNRPPRLHHPSYRQLLEETDSEGVQSNYLAHEEDFQAVRKFHAQNRIIPIVGDLAGPYALVRIGQELRRRNVSLTCFYASNVEFYLFGGQRWDAYVRNLSTLPLAPNACLIRSYARFWQADSGGYYMGTILRSMQQFLANEKSGQNKSYWDLIP
jgi:hypothetical protein